MQMVKMSTLPNYHFFQRDTAQAQTSPLTPPSPSGNKTSPAILFIIIILAVLFFISGLLHLLIRFLVKQRSNVSSYSQSDRFQDNISTSDAFQRQLQQLFQLHDSGLDQAFIDALPVFQYKEIVGLKEPFDCAVCLCEFTDQDKLRLLPLCSHAFHIDCIDTWLLSNSTCPLCRGALYGPGIENPVFEFDGFRDIEDGIGGGGGLGSKSVEIVEMANEKRVFSIRLGKFRSTSNEREESEEKVKDVGESSSNSSSLDARRCFSMGSYQYVVGDSTLQVALCPKRPSRGCGVELKSLKGRRGQNGNFTSAMGDVEARKINAGSKNESLSVSKIWLWSNKKGKFPNSSNLNSGFGGVNVDMSMPWTKRNQQAT